MFYVRRTRSVHCMIKHTCRRPYGAVGLDRSPADDPSPLFAYRVRALDGSRGPRPSHAEPEKRSRPLDWWTCWLIDTAWPGGSQPSVPRLPGYLTTSRATPTPLLTTRWNPTRSWFPPLFFIQSFVMWILQTAYLSSIWKASFVPSPPDRSFNWSSCFLSISPL